MEINSTQHEQVQVQEQEQKQEHEHDQEHEEQEPVHYVVQQVQEQQGEHVHAQVQQQKYDLDAENKKLIMDRDYINKAVQMASTNKFTGEHYVLWKEIMYGILLAADVWCLFDTKQLKQLSSTRSPDYIVSKKANARMVILTGLSKDIASQYTSIKDPVELLKSLDTVYNSNTATTRSEIRNKFENLQLEDYKTVSEYIETLKSTVQKMISMGVQVSDEEKSHRLFAGLTSDFGPTISYLRLANITNFDKIVSTIRDCGVEYDKKQKQANSTDQVHYAGNKIGVNNVNNRNTNNKHGFPFRCYRCQQVGHRISECTKPKPNLNADACIYCKRNNHKSEACYFKHKAHTSTGTSQQTTRNTNIANLVSETVQAVLSKLNINEAHSVTEQENKVKQQNIICKPWAAMLDSAASRHYIKDISLIENMYPLSRPLPVLVANNEIVELNQGGTITIDTSTTPIQLDVTYAPTFKENLISIGQLAKDNNAVTTMNEESARVVFGDNKGEIIG